MNNFSRYLGIAGLLLLPAGAVAYGVLQNMPIVYLLFILAGLCLAAYLIINRARIRTFAGSRAARRGAGSTAGVILVLGIVVFVAIITSKHAARYDMTENSRFSLAPQTVKILGDLKVEVQATAFFQEGEQKERGRDLLGMYAQASPHFKFEVIDPDRNPAQAKAAGITRYGTVVVRSGTQSEKLDNLSEERLTNAMLRVTRPGKKVIYFLSGHGEKHTDDFGKNGFSMVKTALMDQNYEVKPLLLMQQTEVPADAAAVVVAGPQKDPLPQENEALDKYIHQGGKVFFLIDPQSCPDLVKFMTKLGVTIDDDIIVDKISRLAGGDYLMPLVANYTQHPITENFTVASFFPLARSINVAKQKPEGISVVPLASTGDQAWGETDLERLGKQGQAEFEEGKDIKGPVTLAVVGTVQLPNQEKEAQAPQPADQGKKKKEGKFIVFGNSNFATNAYLNLQGNGDLFLSALSWLAEESDLVAIRAKDRAAQPLMLSQMQARLVFWLPVVALPLAVLMIGIMVLTARRRSQ